MEEFGISLIMLGGLTYFFAHFLFVVVAFRMSPGAGIAALFFGCFFYAAMIVMNPQQSWKPLTVAVVGFILMLIGGCVYDVSQRPDFSN